MPIKTQKSGYLRDQMEKQNTKRSITNARDKNAIRFPWAASNQLNHIKTIRRCPPITRLKCTSKPNVQVNSRIEHKAPPLCTAKQSKTHRYVQLHAQRTSKQSPNITNVQIAVGESAQSRRCRIFFGPFPGGDTVRCRSSFVSIFGLGVPVSTVRPGYPFFPSPLYALLFCDSAW